LPIGIIGLSKSGKTTIFNAVTRGHAQTAPFRAGGTQPHLGVAKVPDQRLSKVVEIVRPKRVVQAELEFIDIPGAPEGLGKSRGIGGEYLNLLQRCDALVLVVRAFEDLAVPHPEQTIDPHRDLATMQMELAFSDLGTLERREQRIEASMKGAKAAERDALLKEAALVRQIREALEAEVPVREQALPAEARGVVENFHLLTAKPLITVFNIGEAEVASLPALDEELRKRYARPKVEVAGVCGKLEMELAQMPPAEEAEFRASLHAGVSALEGMVQLTHRVLDLIDFLTASEEEARAWSIKRGTTALQAAGGVHSDMERGFIRAELVAFDDLVKAGSMAEAKRQGHLRYEGKQYVLLEGDVVKFLFNV
jgi:GTP-binding protein YchF